MHRLFPIEISNNCNTVHNTYFGGTFWLQITNNIIYLVSYYIMCHTECPSREVSTDFYVGGSGFGPVNKSRVADRFFWISCIFRDITLKRVTNVIFSASYMSLLCNKCDQGLVSTSKLLPKKMEQIECSETLVILNQTPGNHPKEDILYSKHGESLKSRVLFVAFHLFPSTQKRAIFSCVAPIQQQTSFECVWCSWHYCVIHSQK
jgi:hypothetical protein